MFTAPTASSLKLPADPRAAYLARKAEIDAAVLRTLESGWYIQGREVAQFEEEFARYVGVSAGVGTGSGTDALELALRTCGIGPGDLVVTVSHTACATVTAIDLVGATPLLIDVDPATYTMDPARLEATLQGRDRRRVRAVIPVHLYGHPADMPAIARICENHGVTLIEDCAQSHGATVAGRMTGSWGHFGAFSFYPTKNLGALGDGGALVTNDLRLAERAQCLKQYGWKERYVCQYAGMNTRLDEVQAAVLRVKLPYLDEDNARRRQLASIYGEELSGTPLGLPVRRGDVEHVYHQYVVRTPRRDDLRDHLKKHGVGTAVLYPLPCHLQPAYRERVVAGAGGLEQTEKLCQEILSLPLHPGLEEEQVRQAAELVREWAGVEDA